MRSVSIDRSSAAPCLFMSRSYPFRSGSDEYQSLILPARDSANHLLHRPAESGQSERCAIGAVAVRTAAIHDEQRVRRVRGEMALVDLSVRKIDGAPDVAFGIKLRTAHIENHESRILGLQRLVDVIAVGLESQQSVKVRDRLLGSGGGNIGNAV